MKYSGYVQKIYMQGSVSQIFFIYALVQIL